MLPDPLPDDEPMTGPKTDKVYCVKLATGGDVAGTDPASRDRVDRQGAIPASNDATRVVSIDGGRNPRRRAITKTMHREVPTRPNHSRLISQTARVLELVPRPHRTCQAVRFQSQTG